VRDAVLLVVGAAAGAGFTLLVEWLKTRRGEERGRWEKIHADRVASAPAADDPFVILADVSPVGREAEGHGVSAPPDRPLRWRVFGLASLMDWAPPSGARLGEFGWTVAPDEPDAFPGHGAFGLEPLDLLPDGGWSM